MKVRERVKVEEVAKVAVDVAGGIVLTVLVLVMMAIPFVFVLALMAAIKVLWGVVFG